MKIVADENMPMVHEYFDQFGEVRTVPGRLLKPEDVQNADVLLVRSVTKVNQALLDNSSVGFVGTATIGVDHIDTAYLQRRGITLCSAPGCNAQAVVDYLCSALLRLERLRGLELTDKVVGIVGLGNVGRRVQAAMQRLGLTVLACDPPLAEQGVSGLVPFTEVLNADIVTIHTPLTTGGAYPTYHLFDQAVLEKLKPNAVLVNAARGAVVDGLALGRWLEQREEPMVVLDVWEGEPLIDRELAQRVDIATPHIAGYSFDGKLRGTDLVYRGFCAWQGCQPDIAMASLVPDEARLVVDLIDGQSLLNAAQLIDRVYDIMEDDLNLRSVLKMPRERRVAAFDQLRKHYKMRREFAQVELRQFTAWAEQAQRQDVLRVRALGFHTDSPAITTGGAQ
jgi:erythronate-4-phosphate dehydrogenase